MLKAAMLWVIAGVLGKKEPKRQAGRGLFGPGPLQVGSSNPPPKPFRRPKSQRSRKHRR